MASKENLLDMVSGDIGEIASKVGRSMVGIYTDKHRLGAGTVWHKDGFIVTNAHVIKNGRKLWVESQYGDREVATVLGVDPTKDIAVLSIPSGKFEAMDISDSRALKPGEFVMAMGYPWGVPDGLTAGVVITVGPWIEGGRMNSQEWLIASLRLRPGHSGGPMLDSRGTLVGMNTMMHGLEVGAAVPSHVISASVKRMVGTTKTEL